MAALPLCIAITAFAGLPDAGVDLESPTDVSMVQLIATPQEFHGRRVRVIAYISLEFEETALFLHKEDWNVGNSSNAVWLEGADQRLWSKAPRSGWVIVEGTFDRTLTGHMGSFSGGLKDVSRVQAWKPRR